MHSGAFQVYLRFGHLCKKLFVFYRIRTIKEKPMDSLKVVVALVFALMAMGALL